MKASEMAGQAAAIMSERGHCKMRMQDDDGRVCFSGALMAAGFGDALYWYKIQRDSAGQARYQRSEGYANFDAVHRFASRILADRGEIAFPVVFNNREDVTGEDVILLLKETAAALEEAGA